MGLSIATKIFLAFTAMLLLFASVSTFNVYQMRSIHEEVALINGGYVPLSMALSDIKGDLRTYNVLLGEREWEALRRTVSATAQHYNFPKQLNIKVGRTQEHVGRLLKEPLEERDQVFLMQLDAQLEQIREMNASFEKRSERFTEAVLAERRSESEALQTELQRMARRFESRLRAAQQSVREEIDTSMLRAQRGEQRALGGAVALSILALGLSAGIMLVVHFTIRPLRRLTEGAKRIAGGDYERVAPVRSRDEIGVLAREFNAMVTTLAERDAALREQAAKLERVNARLVELRNFNEDILNSVNTAIVAVSPEGHVTSANRSAERLYEQSQDSLIGSQATVLPPLKAVEQGAAQLQDVMRNGNLHQHEALEIKVGGGKEVGRFDLRLLPLQARSGAEGGSIHGALVVCDNVTERVNTKEALIKSERLAAVGEIATRVTHELRNPLSTIRLNAELLADELEEQGVEADSEAQGTLRDIVSEVERLTSLTEDYLRFARLPDPNPVPGDLNELVEDVVDFQRDELEWNGVEVDMTLDPALPMVRLDEAQMRRALLNLIRNAREAMDNRDVRRLTVRTVARAIVEGQEGQEVVLEVSDTGSGIKTEALEHIFDPFFSTKTQGTGLGLPLTLQIVEEHDGRLTCTSAPEQGTTFTMRLPPTA